MPVQSTTSPSGGLIHTHNLANVNLALDNTSERWFLQDGQASIIKGRDVTRPGTLAADRGRQSLGVVTTLTGITDGHGIEWVARAGTRITGIHIDDSGTESGYAITVGTPATFEKLDAPVAWPSACVGALFVLGEDERYNRVTYSDSNEPPKAQVALITSISGASDEILNLTSIVDPTGVGSDALTDTTFKFHILYPESHDKRGIWYTNGDEFWLLHAGSFTRYLNIAGSDTVGERWDATRIHPNTIMFVNDKYPPRVLRINGSANATGEGTFAGLIPPRKPPQDESITDAGPLDRSWLLGNVALTSDISYEAGSYRVVVRAVNLDDDLYSDFVTAWNTTDPSSDKITLTAGQELAVRTTEYLNAHDPPPIHSRATHIEIWRSKKDSTDYHLVNRLEIADWPNEYESTHSDWIAGEVPSCIASANTPITIDDEVALASLPLLESSEIGSNGLPPLCRKVVSLGGTTICGGRAADDADPSVTLTAKDFYSNKLDITQGASSTITLTAKFVNYNFEAGDNFVLVDGGVGGATPGTYDITAANDNDLTVTGSLATTSGDATGYITRDYSYDYPQIRDDEDIWYSRTDIFAPESFPTRTLRLSSIGDDFRDMVEVGNFIAVIMRSGVHLLFKTVDGRLDKKTIAQHGQGTPWEYSVVSFGKTALWASIDGPKMLQVTDEASITGNIGTIKLLGGPAIRKWFRDAFDDGKVIDAGVDEINSCVRWRRSDPNDAYSFQVLQYNIQTQLWTELEDDNGISYAASSYADSTEKTGLALYGVTATGACMEVNYQGLTHRYDDSSDVLQGTIAAGELSGSGTVTFTRVGAFSTGMVGDMIRFYVGSTTTLRGIREITDATGFNSIEFAEVSGLTVDDTFRIAANQFKIRWAHLGGKLRHTVKTILGALVYLRPGDRNTGVSPWPAEPAATITATVYDEFSDTAVSQPSGVTETVGIFDESETDKTTEDRAVGVEGQGTALEFELSCIETRADFSIEKVEVTVEEEGDFVADADTGS
jgi:hypothetical protein